VAGRLTSHVEAVEKVPETKNTDHKYRGESGIILKITFSTDSVEQKTHILKVSVVTL
jgi:hypothetical protein